MANSSNAPAAEQIQFGYNINGSFPVYGTANWLTLGTNQSYLTSQAPVGDSRGWTHWAWTVSGTMSTFYRNGFYVNTVDMGPVATILTSNQRVLHYLGAGVSLADNRYAMSITMMNPSNVAFTSSRFFRFFQMPLTLSFLSFDMYLCVFLGLRAPLNALAVPTGVNWAIIACTT
jgi:hypothetical protein